PTGFRLLRTSLLRLWAVCSRVCAAWADLQLFANRWSRTVKYSRNLLLITSNHFVGGSFHFVTDADIDVVLSASAVTGSFPFVDQMHQKHDSLIFQNRIENRTMTQLVDL